MESSIPYIVLGLLYAYLLYLSWTPDTLRLMFASKYWLPEVHIYRHFHDNILETHDCRLTTANNVLIFLTLFFCHPECQLSGMAKMFSSEMTLASAWIHLLAIDLFAARYLSLPLSQLYLHICISITQFRLLSSSLTILFHCSIQAGFS